MTAMVVKDTMAVDPPFIVALNLTRRCNLACAHCYLDAGTRDAGAEDELTTNEVCALLDDIAALSDETMVVLTGGEPMLRPDLEAVAQHGAGLGLMMVIGTNGTALDDKRVAKLLKAGVSGVGISLDSLDPAYHDGFRGRPGAWKKTMAAIDACRRGGLVFQLHFSVTDDNADELDDMVAFARSAGAMVLNVFFLVCTGRGEEVTNISRQTYDDVMRRLTRIAYEEKELMVRAKCAPHFKRMALELDPSWPITLAHGYEAGGCLAGTRYCRVTPNGEVTPCPYMEGSAGSVREDDFATIWRQAPLFAQLRAPVLEGRCGACEYAKVCGGCRARPLARDGNIMGEDFICAYQPTGGAVIEPMPDRGRGMNWSTEAEARLKHVPPFVRRMVRKKVEDYVMGEGRGRVRLEDMQEVARRRFGDAGPPAFAAIGGQERRGRDD
jgi:radical SAM protein with 4Fe4S-binding SPASM domain